MEIEQVDEPTRQVLVMRKAVPMAELPAFLGEAFGRCLQAAMAGGLSIVSRPTAWYHGVPTDTMDVAAGFAVEAPVGELPEGVTAVERPGGPAVVAIHRGPYERLQDSYRVVESWMAERNLVPRHDVWEEYLTDPQAEPDQAKWETRLVLPVANAAST